MSRAVRLQGCLSLDLPGVVRIAGLVRIFSQGDPGRSGTKGNKATRQNCSGQGQENPGKSVEHRHEVAPFRKRLMGEKPGARNFLRTATSQCRIKYGLKIMS